MRLEGEAKVQAGMILNQQGSKPNHRPGKGQPGSKAGGTKKTKGQPYAPFSSKHRNAVRGLINNLRRELADYAAEHNLNLSQIGALLSVYLEVEGFTSWQAFLSLRGLARKSCTPTLPPKRMLTNFNSISVIKWNRLFENDSKVLDQPQDEANPDGQWADEEDEGDSEGSDDEEEEEGSAEDSSLKALSQKPSGKPPQGGVDIAKEAQVYRSMRDSLQKEDLNQWGANLKSEALRASLSLNHRTASGSQCEREANAAQKELESYVSISNLIYHHKIPKLPPMHQVASTLCKIWALIEWVHHGGKCASPKDQFCP